MNRLLYKQVAESIEKDIRTNNVTMGMSLSSERELAAKYHVSRTVIRQALSLLAEKKLVDLVPGKGAIITYICDEKIIEMVRDVLLSNQESFLNILEVREVLELAIIQKCFDSLTKSTLDDLYELWEKMEEYRAKNNIELFLQGDRLFHEQLAKSLPNPMFLLLLQTVFASESPGVFSLSRTSRDILEKTQYEHLMILEGLKSKNVCQALHAMETQMNNIRKDLQCLSGKEV